MFHAIRCPKCLSHNRLYQAPLGKIVRNPEAISYGKMFDDCVACNGTGYVPLKIIDSIQQAFPKSANDILTKLRWSVDHWSFDLHGIYVGVESDGYIHS